MTLFSGYSMIPSAPAALRRGISSRTMLPLTMVSTASQSSEWRLEIVGAFSEGSRITTRSRFSRETFIFSPTFPSAWREPLRSRRICSIFCLFHGSSHAPRLAISLVLVFINSWMILSLLARKGGILAEHRAPLPRSRRGLGVDQVLNSHDIRFVFYDPVLAGQSRSSVP